MRPQRRRTAPVRFTGINEEDSSDDDKASNDDDSSAKVQEESSSDEEAADDEKEADDEDELHSGVQQQEDSAIPEEDKALKKEHSEDDGQDIPKETPTNKSKPRRPRKPRPVKPRKEKPVCPHCDKVFSVPSRLVYHVKNFVCRPELRKEEESTEENGEILDDNNGVKVDEEGDASCMYCDSVFESLNDAQEHIRGYVCRARPKQESDEEFHEGEGAQTASNGKSKSTKKGKRGKKKSEDKEESMSCPLCKRVFSSVGGIEYHRKNKVCLNTKTRKIAFPTIPPGELFDTKYGVIRVIKDDRGSSNVQLPSNILNEMKKYASSRGKREIQIQKHHSNVATSSLARRVLLSRLYDKNACTQSSVFEAYYGLDPRQLKSFKKAAPYPRELKNPNFPAQSNPDRIVECVLVPDERPRYIGLDSPHPMEGLADESATRKPTKLFLQRRLLTKTYSPTACRFFCGSCMQCFISRSGFTHHESNGNCAAKIEAAKEKKVEHRKSIEIRAAQVVLRHDTPKKRAVPRGAKPKIVNTGTGKALKEKTIKREAKELVSPVEVIAQLKAELYAYQGSMIGPVYPSVWKALGYKKPSLKKKKKKKRKKRKKKRKRKVLASAPEKKIKTSAEANTASMLGLADEWGTEAASWMMPPPELLPAVPVVDTRVIVAEVVSGRYPTMKRYDGEHETFCAICKRQELSTKKSRQALIQKHHLLECGFCKQVVHFQCMLDKFIVKDPEPEDEFICHSCIQTVTHRRKRAEKRRLEKLDMEPQSEDEMLAKRRKVATLVAGDIQGQEYESISAQLQRIDELSVLLEDSKARLLSSMKTAQINESACALVSDFEEAHSSQFHASTTV